MPPRSEPIETAAAEEEETRGAEPKVEEMEPLIPGLPDEVAEQCLLHLPFPYQSLARSVSSSWNRALSSSSFIRSKAKAAAALSLPYLFAFAFDRSTLRLQWQALDCRTSRWFVLPPMPLPAGGDGPLCPPAFACAAIPGRGELYVLGGMRADTQSPLQTLLAYRAGTNSWSAAAPMPTPRCFFAAGAIGGRIFAAGGDDGGISAVECYDPAADRWAPAAGMRRGMARYDAAVVGRRMYVTEGWTWPFDSSPRGGVYDADRDAWEEMRVGMREGWTGASAVVGGRLYVVSECGDGRVKAYDEGTDRWRAVAGGAVPAEVKRPYAVTGGGAAEDGRIYVVGSGLDVGVGTVVASAAAGGRGAAERVEWQVVKGPPAFADLAPCNALVLYA
ncbi:F-box protein AFR-like [Musa acuminata AAA Group]|uniref:F-box protein AFR-like n=1 Tax=Musa acuminata AAA Group TaxID=214697 RepID=UPI0031D58575